MTHPYCYSDELRGMLDKKYGPNIWENNSFRRIPLLQATLADDTEIEITFNNITGLLNSEYVRTLAEIDSRFHKLGYFIKHFVSSRQIFDSDTKKLNSFSLICMLIVFLQDKCSPPVLPRIINMGSSVEGKELISPSYITVGDGSQNPNNYDYKVLESNLDFNFEYDHEEIQSFMKLEVNQDSVSELFKKFVHFYFGGGGFDPIHDVVNTREGKIQKIRSLGSILDKRVKKKLDEAFIAVLDPFDMSYCPSSNFELYSWTRKKSMIKKMVQFIR
ncbi:unnamed protein product [Moneuplotes crassus]|uniref:PAP-associated domain-containing protein n=1 Tax=Euplotes crassus TaxID=5936 RepID=A0AAD1Y8B6_EUPCR|nr:unnamed protein product [Moneuplotes crassus]